MPAPRKTTATRKPAAAKKTAAKRTTLRKAPVRTAYKRPTYKGYGAYAEKKAVVKKPRAEEESFFESNGGKLGKWVGTKLGSLLGSIIGFGDYEVEHNSIMKGGMTPPQIVNSSNHGGFIVRHREYIKDIKPTLDFSIESFTINPGDDDTFPWLATLSQNFEEYRMRGLIFEFKSMSSDAVLSTAASSGLGSVIMSTQYNVLQPAFADKAHMENYEFATSSKPSCTFIHPVECKASMIAQSHLYIRNTTSGTGDARLYDLGKFSIATQGCQGDEDAVIGELWASYEVELYFPRQSDALIGGPMTDHYSGDFASSDLMFGQPETEGSVLFHDGTMPGSAVATDATLHRSTYTFPPEIDEGTFQVTYHSRLAPGNTNCAISAISDALLTNCELVLYFNNGSGVGDGNRFSFPNAPNASATVTGTDIVDCIIVKVTEAGASIKWDTTNFVPPNDGKWDLVVTRIAALSVPPAAFLLKNEEEDSLASDEEWVKVKKTPKQKEEDLQRLEEEEIPKPQPRKVSSQGMSVSEIPPPKKTGWLR